MTIVIMNDICNSLVMVLFTVCAYLIAIGKMHIPWKTDNKYIDWFLRITVPSMFAFIVYKEVTQMLTHYL